jgi:hypothetical protein
MRDASNSFRLTGHPHLGLAGREGFEFPSQIPETLALRNFNVAQFVAQFGAGSGS